MPRNNGYRNLKSIPQTPHIPLRPNRPSKRASALENRAPVIPPRLRRISKSVTDTVITYVLDTNVPMSDWRSLFRFKEHRVVLVDAVWRELDAAKKGMDVVAWNARKAMEAVDDIITKHSGAALMTGVPLTPPEDVTIDNCTGCLILDFSRPQIPEGLPINVNINKPDDQILMLCHARKERGEHVVLVSDDRNLRARASVIDIESEPYLYDTKSKIVGEEDQRTGFHVLPSDFWDTYPGDANVQYKDKGQTVYHLSHPSLEEVYPNEFLILPDNKEVIVREVKSEGRSTQIVAQTFTNFNHNPVFGIMPRNREQDFALQLLTNPEVTGVGLAGKAGSGKTFLATGAALAQILDTKRYRSLVFTRTLVDADKPIGFIPGTEAEKMRPWARPLYDNLKVLLQPEGSDNETWESTMLQLQSKIEVVSMNTLQGSTFSYTFIIVDEAQNLTREGLKMLMTRVGVGSKIVFLGNVAQIFNQLLTEETNGISLFIRRFIDLPFTGHVTLQEGVRSDLATVAEDRL
jgi:PhoH-like ATPase